GRSILRRVQMAVARAEVPGHGPGQTPAPKTPARRSQVGGMPISESDVQSFEIDGFYCQQGPGNHGSDGCSILTIAKIQIAIELDLVLPVGGEPGPEKWNLIRISLIFLTE